MWHGAVTPCTPGLRALHPQKERFTAGIAAKRAAGSTGPSTEAVQYWEVPGAGHFVPWTHAAELAATVAPVLASAVALA